MDVYEIRRLNARVLSAEAGGPIEFGTKLERAQSLISRWIGKTKAPKNIGNNAARQIEAVFGRPAGWLDQEHRKLWEGHGFVQPSQHKRETNLIPSERALRIAQIIDEASPKKVQAILLLLGVHEEDIRRLPKRCSTSSTSQDAIPQTGDRRSGKDRRQNIRKVDFERRSGKDRRASQPFFDDEEMQKKYGRPEKKTNKSKRRKDGSNSN
jgi:hypothetical protein